MKMIESPFVIISRDTRIESYYVVHLVDVANLKNLLSIGGAKNLVIFHYKKLFYLFYYLIL